MSVLTLRGSNPPSLPILVSSVPHTQITYHHHHLFSMEGTGLAVEGRGLAGLLSDHSSALTN